MGRRSFLWATGAFGALAAGLPPQINVRKTRDRVSILIDGHEVWAVDRRWFLDAPILTLSRTTDGFRLALRQSRFPGLLDSADFTCAIRLVPRPFVSFDFTWAGAHFEGPLLDWLTGRFEASTRVGSVATLSSVVSGLHVSVKNAALTFRPDWTLEARSADVALRSSQPVHADLFSLRVGASGGQLLKVSGAATIGEIRTSRPWSAEHFLPTGEVTSGLGPMRFEHVNWEAGYDDAKEARLGLCLEKASTDNSPSFELDSALVDLQGAPYRLPLVNPRLAWAAGPDAQETSLMAAYPADAGVAWDNNIRYQFGSDATTLPFEVGFANDTLTHAVVEPALLDISAPLPDGASFTTSHKIAPSEPLEDCETPAQSRRSYRWWAELLPPIRSWWFSPSCLPTGKKEEFGIPLGSFELNITRPQDFLILKVRFESLFLKTRFLRTPQLAPGKDASGAYKPGLLRVEFPPQHIHEEAFRLDETGQGTLRYPPIDRRLAGPSRLVFEVAKPIDYTLDSLLRWSDLQLRVPAAARLPPKDQHHTTNLAAEPHAFETSIEAPYRLFLSPHGRTTWAHKIDATCDDNGRVELWHTRMALRGEDGVPDDRAPNRTLRAVWSPDFNPNSTEHPNPSTPPFAVEAIRAADRHQIVHLTSNYALDWSTSNPSEFLNQTAPIGANRLMLTSLGISMDVRGSWNALANTKLDLIEWINRTVGARDFFVRVAYKGFLCPCGLPCTLIYETERMFARAPITMEWVAYLRQRKYLKARAPSIDYSKALGLPYEGRLTLFRRIDFHRSSYTSPLIDDEIIVPGTQRTFWPTVMGRDLEWKFTGLDQQREITELRTPQLYVGAGDAVDPAKLEIVAAHYKQQPLKRRMAVVDGRRVAYAPADRGDETSFVTDDFVWTILKADLSVIEAGQPCDFALGKDENGAPLPEPTDLRMCQIIRADQAAFFPGVTESRVHVDTLNQLTGRDQPVVMDFHDTYVERGFDPVRNRGEIFASLPPTPERYAGARNDVFLGFGGPNATGGTSANGDKAGGLATPNTRVVGFSRRVGLVGGRFSAPSAPARFAFGSTRISSANPTPDPLEKVLNGCFDAADFFSGALLDATILGRVQLRDVIQTIGQGVLDNLGEAPQAVREVVHQTTSDVVNVLGDAARRIGIELDALPPSLQTRVRPSWREFEVALGKVASSSNPERDVSAAIRAFERFADICRTLVEDPQSLLAPELVRLRGVVLDQVSGLFPQLRTLLGPVNELENWLTAAKSLVALLEPSLGGLVQGGSAEARAMVEEWKLEFQMLSGQVSGSLQALTTELTRHGTTITDFAKANVEQILRLTSQLAQDLERLKARTTEIVAGIDLADPAGIKAQIQTRLKDLLRPPLESSLAFRATIEQALDALPAAVRARIADLKARLLTTAQELQEAHREFDATPVQVSEAFLRRRLALEKLFIDTLRRLRDEIQAQPLVTFLVSGPETMVRAQLGSIARVAPAPTTTAGALSIPVTMNLAPDIESWARQYTQLGMALTDPSSLSQRIDALIAELPVNADPLRVRLTQIKANLLQRLTGAAADALANGALFLDELEQIRDRSAVVLLVAGQLTPTEKRQILDARTSMFARRAEYVTKVQTAAANVATVLATARAAVPVQLKPVVDHLLQDAHAGLTALAGPQGLDAWPQATLGVEASIVKLRALLRDPLSELDRLLEFREVIERELRDRLAQLLLPSKIVLTYSWLPRLQSSPGSPPLFETTTGSSLEITARSETELLGDNAGRSSVAVRGVLREVSINLLPGLDFLKIRFDSVAFTSGSGQPVRVNVKLAGGPDAVEFRGPLKFVKALQRYLDPSGGPFFELRPDSLVVGFGVQVPNLSFGAFACTNLRFLTGLTLSFSGGPLRLQLAVSTFQDPFAVSAGILGGRGYFRLVVDAEGVQELEAAIELGVVAQLTIAIASGRAWFVLGILYRVGHGVSASGAQARTTEICAYVRAGGHLSIVGIISVGLEIYVGMRYEITSSRLLGEAEVRAEVQLGFFSKTFSGRARYQYGGGNSLLSPSTPPSLVIDESDFRRRSGRRGASYRAAAVSAAHARSVVRASRTAVGGTDTESWADYRRAFVRIE